MSFTASLEDVVAENRNHLLGSAARWERVRLGDVADILNGFAFPSTQFSSERGLPLLRIRDVGKSTTESLFQGDYDPRYLVQAGDLVIGMDGDFRCALWRGSDALLNQRVCKVSPNEGLYSRRFLAYVLQGYLDAIHEHTSAITVKHLSSRTIAEIPLPLPSVEEQHRVTAALDSTTSRLNAAVGGLRYARANLKRYRASVLKAACEGRLVPTEAELAQREGREFESADVLLERILKKRRARWEEQELANLRAKGKEPKDGWKRKYKEPEEPDPSGFQGLPAGWVWTTLAAISQLQGGLTKGQKRRAGRRYREVPYLRVANVQRGYLDLQEVGRIAASEDDIHRLALRPGDVLFNEGGDRDKLGRGWVWRGELPECIHQNHVFRARLLTADIEPEYVSYYGNSAGQIYFMAQGRQTTNLASINLTKLGALPIPLPPAAEQRRIVQEVERLFEEAGVVEVAANSGLQRAERLRQSVLKRAFEGRLVPQDPTDEPAAVLLKRIHAERQASHVSVGA